MTKVNRLLTALENGEELTAKQIAHRFRAGNPRELVRTLRSEGYPIFLNTRVDTKGRVKNKYSMGTLDQYEMADIYHTMGARIFDRVSA